MARVYLDYNATAPTRPEAARALQAIAVEPMNASSVHSSGRRARQLVEDSRQAVATLVAAPEGTRVVFMGSGTEVNNTVLKGFEDYTIFTSAIEHASVLKTAWQSVKIGVSKDGVVDLKQLEDSLAKTEGKKLVSIMLANNETGVIQPLKEIVQIAHENNAIVHTDAIQAIGKIPVNMEELGVDLMSISAHKWGGPQGAAALIMKKNLPMISLINGGGQEQGIRGGTENVAAIHAMGVAAQFVKESLSQSSRLESMRDQLEGAILEHAEDAKIFGKEVKRLPNTSCIYMPGASNETQLIHFDLAGIDVSAGSACSSGKMDPSYVLEAMGASEDEAASSIRISFGKESRLQDMEAFINSWKQLYMRIAEGQQAA